MKPRVTAWQWRPYLALTLLAGFAVAVGADARAVAAEPDATTPGERLLPAGTLAVATIPDAATFRERWEESSLGAIAEDAAFEEFLDDAKQRIGRLTGGLDINLLELWEDIDGEVTLGVIQNAEQQLSFVAIADFGENTEAAAAFVNDIERRLRKQGSEETSIQAGATELRSWPINSPEGSRYLAYFLRDGEVVIGDGLETLLSLNLKSEGGGPESLAANADYQHVMQQASLDGLPAMQWYVNPTKLLDAAVTENLRGNPNLATLRGLMNAAGLDQFRAAGGTFQMAADGVDNATTTYGYVEQPVQGILKAFEMPATEQRPPDWVHDGVSLYAQMNWSPSRLYETVAEVVDRAQGAGAFDRLAGSLKIGQSDYTYRDVISQLTGPLHVSAEIPESAEGLIRQPAIIAFNVRDAAVMRDIVEELMNSSEITSRQVSVDRIFEIEVPSPLPGQPMRMGLAVAEGALMMSTDVGYLENTLRSQGSRRPLAESRVFQRVAERYPEQTSMISFQRQDQRFEGLYEQLRTGSLGVAGLLGLPTSFLDLDFQKLPPFEAMSRYLQSTGGYIAPTEDGFRMVNFALPPREQ